MKASQADEALPRIVSAKELTALILAGGRGRRLGGIDKGLVEIGDRPLIAWILAALAPQVGAILISANRHSEHYRSLGHPVLTDPLPDYPGPLAGILAGLRAAPSPWILVVPCDAPCLPLDLGTRLARALVQHRGDLAVVHDGERAQWLHALLPVGLADELADFLAQGGRRAEDWLRRYRIAWADYSGQAKAFVNLNTLEDLRNFRDL
ncbi:molybdenum cofactor guanylyltransferase [Caldichromatium japonicum]|uniref:Molybdenum cofactor guanylyltransferase n=1 Tax=Caldichromatium japonicum TaxID=2699430 RepID=A0A6G7VCK2_9GAMM|nr:molybdenum cofactor guanylyltransferase MobA [Caldichromatium japonicum]QIK37517.1 molybdenum cofactor guanylyltransferase [Caldichromatium japonicum]